MLIVGLTGGIACGKSLCTSQLQQQFPVIDADLLAKECTQQGRWGYRRVVTAFGPACLQPDGELDRAALGRLVFSDAAARRQLNAATHMPVAVALLLRLLVLWLQHTPCVVLDMPLLVETGVHKLVGMVVVVSCSPEVQLARLMQRDGSSARDAQARIDSQLPLSVKEQLAQCVIRNDGTREQLEQQVALLSRQLCSRSRSWRTWLTTPTGLVLATAGLCKLVGWLASARTTTT